MKMSTTDEEEGVDISQLEANGFMALDECGDDDEDEDSKVSDSAVRRENSSVTRTGYLHTKGCAICQKLLWTTVLLCNKLPISSD